jgi:hypothetical protein
MLHDPRRRTAKIEKRKERDTRNKNAREKRTATIKKRRRNGIKMKKSTALSALPLGLRTALRRESVSARSRSRGGYAAKRAGSRRRDA